MASKKGTSAPLGSAELGDFVASRADFAFEMQTLRALKRMGFECSHGATYVDHVSGKLRAYDIRARQRTGQSLLCLAVECKALGSAAPLLTYATPRLASESFHYVLVRRYGMPHPDPFSRRKAPSATYPPHQPVVRQTDQPLLSADGSWSAADAATFERWMQAVSSARDIADTLAIANVGQPTVGAVLPVLVVPDGTLWQVQFSESGQQLGAPEACAYTQLFLGHEWRMEALSQPKLFAISHLEICTLSGLETRVEAWRSLEGPVALAVEDIKIG